LFTTLIPVIIRLKKEDNEVGLFAVFLGGGAGSLSRYLLSGMINQVSHVLLPVGTFFVNIFGCFLIGFLFTMLEELVVPSEVRLLLITGFLGGFTTFSSFGLETVNLLKGNETFFGLLNILLSIVIGLLFVILGMALSSLVFKRK